MENSDIVLGKLAISMNMITTQQLSQCISIQKHMQQQGHSFSLVDILLKKNFISNEQHAMLLATAQNYNSQHTTLHAKPQKLGRYVIEKKIGQGGMGYVYKAWDPKLERFVALKVLIHAKSELDIKRFMREAKANAMLRHENIVAIYDMGEEAGQPYFTMDYLEGGSLDARKKQLSFRQAVDILIAMCKAIDFAHKNGVVHRDLKPANIMFDHKGVLKVTDFGLAKVADDQKLSQSGSLIGTALYMSPEQAQGKTREVDHRSDIFALGVILYELISGRVPFIGKNFQQTMHLITTAHPKPLTKIKKTVPTSLDIVCMKALAKKKENRYNSALEFAEDLEKVRSGKRLHHRSSKYIRIIAIALCCAMVAVTYFFIFPKTPPIPVLQKQPRKTVQKATNKKTDTPTKTPKNNDEKQPSEKNNDEKQSNEKNNAQSKLYFPNEQQLPLGNVHAQMRKMGPLESKMYNAKNNSDQTTVNQLAIEIANGYYKAHVLRNEILSLQNIQPKTPDILWRLVNRCMTGKMYIHARYYANEILWQFSGHPLREKAQQEQQKIINAFPIAETSIRQVIWSILRDIAYARVLRIEGKYKTCIDYYEQAWNKANKGAKLFAISSTIKDNTLSLPLRNEFKIANYSLGDKAKLRNIDNNTWAIDDNWQNQYRLHRENDYQSGKVHIYVYAPLLELLPLLKSLQIMSYVHLKQFTAAQKELQNLQITSSRWYPWISHILRKDGFIYEWPETLFSQGMFYFFSGNNNEAQKIFQHIEKNYAPWYVSGERQLFHLNKNYLGQTPDLQQKKWWNMLSEDINKVLDMFLVRGIMNGKLSNNLQIYQQTFEDLLNLEISPYMIRNHLADIYFRKQQYQQAIDNYTLSRHLSPQDIVIFGLGQIALKAQNFTFAKRCYIYLDQHPPVVYKSDQQQLSNFKNHVQQVLRQLGH